MVFSDLNVLYYGGNYAVQYLPLYACLELFGRTCVRFQNDHTPLLVLWPNSWCSRLHLIMIDQRFPIGICKWYSQIPLCILCISDLLWIYHGFHRNSYMYLDAVNLALTSYASRPSMRIMFSESIRGIVHVVWKLNTH